LNSKQKIDWLIREMRDLSTAAEENNVCLGLETSLDAASMIPVIEAIGSSKVKIYFDTGNCAALGYDVVQEIAQLGGHIVQSHIKEAPTDRMLGDGDIDFQSVIDSFKRIGFSGYLIFETPSTGSSVTGARKARSFLDGFVP
jgi:sugar phosphate isomerase/epimerase